MIQVALFPVRKESGIKGRMLDKRVWSFESLAEAKKLFDRRIKAKTNLERKSPRKYRLISQAQNDKTVSISTILKAFSR